MPGHNLSITFKSMSEVEGITLDAVVVEALFSGSTPAEVINIVRGWVRSAAVNRLKTQIAASLLNDYVEEHIKSSS